LASRISIAAYGGLTCFTFHKDDTHGQAAQISMDMLFDFRTTFCFSPGFRGCGGTLKDQNTRTRAATDVDNPIPFWLPQDLWKRAMR
jgi:D-glycero-alpha-D-manno-heptose-7-phosphate kinase